MIVFHPVCVDLVLCEQNSPCVVCDVMFVVKCLCVIRVGMTRFEAV